MISIKKKKRRIAGLLKLVLGAVKKKFIRRAEPL